MTQPFLKGTRALRSLLAASALALLGGAFACGDEGGTLEGLRADAGLGGAAQGGSAGAAPNVPGCVDLDGDGFGPGCPQGGDCDEQDPSVTSECYRCNTPNEGCECPTEGQVAECGEVTSRVGNVVTCSVGQRTCTGGRWSACSAESIENKHLSLPGAGPEAVAVSGTTCVGNPCDPYCFHFGGSTPPSLGPNTQQDSTGISLIPTVSTGGPSSCGTTSANATRAPLGMMLLVDRSGSMGSDSPTRLTTVKNALTTFISSAGVANMYAGFDFFPYGTSSASACDPYQYVAPNLSVNFGVLPGAGNAQRSSITTAISGLTAGGDGTPMLQALQGALDTTATWVSGGAGRKGVAVLVTDGLPAGDCTGCQGKASKGKGKSSKNLAACAVSKVAQLAEGYYYATPPVETFVIGVAPPGGSPTLGYLNVIARAGSGGKRDATIINNNSSATTQIVNALNQIRDAALTCEFNAPNPPGGQSPDPATTVVTYTPSSGAPVSLPRRSSLGACTVSGVEQAGFYFDTGTRKVLLCPQSCGLAKADLGATINVSYQCRAGCASVGSQVQSDPIDLMVMMDRSGSMNDEIAAGVSKWYAAASSIRGFVRSPESAGMRMAISYFPVATGCVTCGYEYGCGFLGLGTCWDSSPLFYCPDPRSSGAYGNCTSPEADGNQGNYKYYSGDRGSTAPADYVNFALSGGYNFGLLNGVGSHADYIFKSVDRIKPQGSTPTLPALQGALNHANANKQAGRKMSVLLITDGDVTGATNAQVVTAAQNGFTSYGIETFVIGIDPGSSTFAANMNAIARAGSGNKFNAFIVNTADTSAFLDALNAVRRRATSCDFNLPTPSTPVNYAAGQVLVTAGSPPTETSLINRGTSAGCGALPGFYYDNASSPTEVRLCPASCDVVRTDVNSRVDIVLPCVNTFTNGSASFEFDSANVCPRGTKPTWADWSWQSSTPSGTRITFDLAAGVRTGGTVSSLSPTIPLRFTRTGYVGQQVCAGLSSPNACGLSPALTTSNGGPLASSPGDAFVDATLVASGLPRDRNYLKITANLNASSDGLRTPVLSAWDLNVSCRPGE